MRKRSHQPQQVVCEIEKLVHGGQGIGTAPDGKRVFAWNVLPGERVVVDCRQNRSKYLEGIAIEILTPSVDRVEPVDEAYLSTSPWQMMTFAAENSHKQAILAETFAREHVALTGDIPFVASDQESGAELHYRNKMEYSFWGDETGLHLALYHRGSHGKRIVRGSSLAMPAIDQAANQIVALLNRQNVRASQLKTVMLRASQDGAVVAALFVKDEDFPDLPDLQNTCKGVVVNYSNPKSPASVLTKELYRYGTIALTDAIRGVPVTYDVHSFFQVNIPIFLQALEDIATACQGQVAVDMYSGVGTIGLSVGGANVLVDSDAHNCAMARHNAAATNAEVVEAPAEKALEYIDDAHVLIVDPPRAGLHADVVERIRQIGPPAVVYLSCNPITQARDLALLQDMYHIESLTGYNFFPRTPHIECLAVLRHRD